MSWKKTLPFFVFQSVRFARNPRHFFEIWGYYSRWKKSFEPGRNSVADELPWLNFSAVNYLQEHIQAGIQVFEFGGGGSTLFFCKNGAAVATVEDHPEWFKILTETVSQKGYRHWQGFFVASEPYSGDKTKRSPADPADFMSGSRGMEQLSFEKYARTIDSFPDNHFDIILVDGRARPSCAQQAIPKLKPGGLLVIDNTERAYYLEYFRGIIREAFDTVLHQYAPVAYTPDFTRTTILRKR